MFSHPFSPGEQTSKDTLNFLISVPQAQRELPLGNWVAAQQIAIPKARTGFLLQPFSSQGLPDKGSRLILNTFSIKKKFPKIFLKITAKNLRGDL